MVLVNFFFLRKKTPAEIAKKRLQEIISEHKIRDNFTPPYYLSQLKKDLIQAISKHTHEPHILSIQLEKKDNNTSILKCKIIFFNEKT